MPDDMQAQTLPAGTGNNGTSSGAPGTLATPLLAINTRLPKGRVLPDYGIEYFNQLVAQYLTLPLAAKDAPKDRAIAVVEEIIKTQNDQRLNWGDVSGMEMALLQLLPEAELKRYAWNLRARYHEVAGQDWYDYYQQSRPPDEAAPIKEAAPVTVSVTNTPPGTLSSVFLLTPPASDAAEGTPAGDTASASLLRADMSILLGDLQRLRSTIQSREEKRSDISKWGALLAVACLICALAVYAGPRIYLGQFATATRPLPAAASRTAPALLASPAAPAKSASAAQPTTIIPMASTSTPPAPVSSPLEILQTVILVSLCGVMGGLISMLRRLQTMAPGSSPLIDTIALNAGQFGIGLSPVYGAIFAVVLYVIFLSGLLNSIIAPTAQAAVFPQFLDATPASTPDYTKLLVWGFIAGFAEKLVPDVLDRLTAKNTAAGPAKGALPSGTAPPAHPT